MNKSYLILSFLVFSGCITYSSLPKEPMVTVSSVEGVNKDDLYSRALLWSARSFNSANDVVQLKDEENGRIVLQGVGNIEILYRHHFRYTMIIEIKDEKIRTTFENISPYPIGDIAGADPRFNGSEISAYLNQLQRRFIASVTNPVSSSDW